MEFARACKVDDAIDDSIKEKKDGAPDKLVALKLFLKDSIEHLHTYFLDPYEGETGQPVSFESDEGIFRKVYLNVLRNNRIYLYHLASDLIDNRRKEPKMLELIDDYLSLIHI